MWKGHVVLLASGKGTRMGAISKYMPKCLHRIDDKPLIVHHLERFENAGVQRASIVIDSGLGLMIRQSIQEGYDGTMEIDFIVHDRNRGTGPGHALAECRTIRDSPLLVYASDEYRRDDEFHRFIIAETESPEVEIAVAVARFNNERISEIGNVGFDGDTRAITTYVNKPQASEVVSEWGTTGGWAFFDSEKLFSHLDQMRRDQKLVGVDLTMALTVKKLMESGFRARVFLEPDGDHIHLTTLEDVKNASG